MISSCKGAQQVTRQEEAERFAKKAPPLNQAERDAINALLLALALLNACAYPIIFFYLRFLCFPFR